jgi:hypothetical protein
VVFGFLLDVSMHANSGRVGQQRYRSA